MHVSLYCASVAMFRPPSVRRLPSYAVLGLVLVGFVVAPAAAAQFWWVDSNNPDIVHYACETGNVLLTISQGGVSTIRYDAPNGTMIVDYTNGTQVLETISCNMPDFDAGGDTSVTQCSTLNTVCVTAAAISEVVCGKVYPIFDYCQGVGEVGGHGASPVQLPGRLDWDGKARCTLESNVCPEAGTWKYRSGSATWPGLVGADGSGNTQRIDFLRGQVYGGCIGDGTYNNNIYRVYSWDEAIARSYIPLTTITIESVGAEVSETGHGYTCP